MILPNKLVQEILSLPFFCRAASCDENIIASVKNATPILFGFTNDAPKGSLKEIQIDHLKSRRPHTNLILSALAQTFDCAYYMLIVSDKRHPKQKTNRKQQFLWLCGNEANLEATQLLYAHLMEELEGLAVHRRTVNASDLIPQERKLTKEEMGEDWIKPPTELDLEKVWKNEMGHSIALELKDIRKKLDRSKFSKESIAALTKFMEVRIAAQRRAATNIYKGQEIEVVRVPHKGNGVTMPWEINLQKGVEVVSYFHQRCREALRLSGKGHNKGGIK